MLHRTEAKIANRVHRGLIIKVASMAVIGG